MTSAGGAGSPASTQAELAAAVLAEEERRRSDVDARTARDSTSDLDDVILDGPFLAIADTPTSGWPGPRSVLAATTVARRVDAFRSLATGAAAAVASAVALAGLGRGAGVGFGTILFVSAAVVGVVTGARRPRRWTVRSAPRQVQQIAVAAAAAGVLAPITTGAPHLVGQLLQAVILGVLVHTGIAALLAASGLVPPALRTAATTGAALRASVMGAITGALLLLMVHGTSDLRSLVLGVVPTALLAAGAVGRTSAAITADAVAAGRADVGPTHGTPEANSSSDVVATAIEIRHLDFSYGHVQVLFDVSVDLHDGEVLALLGTNGAGKSTLLRALSGLAPVDRGTIHHRGVDITHADAGDRVRSGIVQLPGGKAVFPSLSVLENLLAGGYLHIWDKRGLTERIEEVVSVFPVLRDRLSQPAGTLSGGEQQMLAFAKALLLDPDVLCIDELSLGLAPRVVQELLVIVERLKARRLTMVIVEQSLNVALAVADRAVFMEKGRVRFDGPARELAERGDLARAVFLGGEGG